MIFTTDHNFIKMFGLHMNNFSVQNMKQMDRLIALLFLLILLMIDVKFKLKILNIN